MYIDLMEAGERKKGAGFLKLEETDSNIKWQIQVKGLRETDTGFFDLRDETGALVDKMLLKAGTGSYVREFGRSGTSRGGREFSRICGVRLELSGGRALEGRWKLTGGDGDHTGKGSVVEDPGGSRTDSVYQKKNCMRGKKEREQNIERDDAGEAYTDGKGEEEKGEEEKGIREEHAVTAAELPAEEYADNKWDQLGRIYPTVHPFGDDREYLSITPRDFVILSREYQKLVHNSFLLHGYYNYRHVILGRFGKEEDEKYYLGVPGVFYDREKMAAEMFGFEAFEGKASPVEPGSFGYYMKRVQI